VFIPQRKKRWDEMNPTQQLEWTRYRSMGFFVYDMNRRNGKLNARIRARRDAFVIIASKNNLSARIDRRWTNRICWMLEILAIVKCPWCKTGPLDTCDRHV